MLQGTEALEKSKQAFINEQMHGGDHGSHKPVAVADNDDDDEEEGVVDAVVVNDDDDENDEGMSENILPEHHAVFSIQRTVGYLQEHPLINRTVFRTQTSIFSG